MVPAVMSDGQLASITVLEPNGMKVVVIVLKLYMTALRPPGGPPKKKARAGT